MAVRERRDPASRVVAVVGARSFFGKGLLDELSADPDIERVIAVDLRPPAEGRSRVAFHRIDVTRPSADQELADVFEGERVGAVVHVGFLASPASTEAEGHELEVIGTMHLLAAVAAARVPRLVVQSTTAVYGAHPKNPALLTEEHPLRGARSRFIQDKVEAEGQVARFAREHGDTDVCVLRFAPVLGPSVKNVMAAYLRSKIAPTVLGFDPLLQALHEDDARAALSLALRSDRTGVYNVVAPGVMALSTALRLCGTAALPVFGPAAVLPMRLLRTAGVLPGPASLLDYLQFTWVADGSRFRDAFGFHPRHTTRDAVVALAQR